MSKALKYLVFGGVVSQMAPISLCSTLFRVALVVAFSLALAASVFAKGGGWPRCRGADPDGRIAGCTEVIARIAKESRHNKIAAYFNRGGAYQAKSDFDLRHRRLRQGA